VIEVSADEGLSDLGMQDPICQVPRFFEFVPEQLGKQGAFF